MKLLILTALVSLSVSAQDLCVTPPDVGTSLNECVENVVSVLAVKPEYEDSPEAVIKAANLFFEKYKDRVDFELNTALSLIERLKKHGSSTALSPEERSKFWLLASGVHGRVSDKLRANGGLEHGKEALVCLKTSLQLDKTHKQAAIAYATTITNMNDQSTFNKIFIEKGLGIKLKDEVKSSLKAMEDAELTDHELYKKLKSYKA